MNPWLLLLWLIVPIGNVWMDRKRPARDNYIQVNLVRGALAIIHGAWVMPSGIDFGAVSGWGLLMYALPLWAYQIASYWVVFEAGLNLVWKEALLYYDTDEGNSGWVDRFFKWAGKWAHAAAKLLALAGAVYSFKLLLSY